MTNLPKSVKQLVAVRVDEDSYVVILSYDLSDQTSSEVRLRIIDVFALAEKSGLPNRPQTRMTKGSTDILVFTSATGASQRREEAAEYRTLLDQIASG
jgi:hypothetical protein